MAERKEPQLSSFDIKILVKELEEKLTGCYVDKVYQVGPKSLLFRLTKPGETARMLVVEAGRRIHLTRYLVEKPPRPPPFCAALRKHLTNARISKVEQPNLERIVILHFSSGRGAYRLVAELFARGNLLLLDEAGRIVQALSQRKMGGRSFLKGEIYQLPSSGATELPESVEKLHEALKGFRGEVVKALTRIYGVGGLYAEEFLARAGVDKAKKSREVSLEEAEKIHRAALEVFRLLEKPEPMLYLDGEGKPMAVAPFPLKRLEAFTGKRFPSLNEAVDELFSHGEAERAKRLKEEQLKLRLEELKRIVAEQEAAVKALEEQAVRLRRMGEAAFRNAPLLQDLLKRIEVEVAGGGWQKAQEAVAEAKGKGEYPLSLVEGFEPKERKVKVSLEGLTLELKLGKSAYENASAYYDEAKVLEGKLSRLKAALEETRRKMAEVEEQVSLEEAEPAKPVRLREKKWFEKFRFFHTSEGFLVVAGKDASSNEALIKRHTEPRDLVFHTELPGSPFVVLKTEGKQPSEASLREAAVFAACYSRAWREGFSAVDVYYVKPEQLSKSAPSGEYLPRGSFMVYGKRTYLEGVPLRLALTVNPEDSEYPVKAVPPETAQAEAGLWAEIAPGNLKAKDLASKVKSRLVELASKEEKPKLLRIPVEAFSPLIPYGVGSLVGVFKGRRLK